MHRKTQLRPPVWLGCLALGLALGSGCRPPGRNPPTVSEFHGCDEVSRAATADPDAAVTYVWSLAAAAASTAVIWTRVATPPGASPAEQWSLEAATGTAAGFSPDGRLRIEVTRAALPHEVVLRARAPFRLAARRMPTLRLRFAVQTPLPAEKIVESSRQHKNILQGIDDLRRAAAQEPYRSDPAARARLLHAQAGLEVDAARHKDALAHYQQALELAEPAGLTSLVANAARHLAFQHYTVWHDINAALAILEKYDPAIRMIAIDWALSIYNRAVYAQERGDLRDALRYVRLAEAAVRELGDPETHLLVQVERALVLALQGMARQAESVVAELLAEFEKPGSAFEACDRMDYLNTLGWTRILEQESRSPGAQDPIPLLELAMKYRAQDGCPNDGKNVDMNRARAELPRAQRLAAEAAAPEALEDALTAALTYFDRGRAALSTQPLSKQMDAAELGGRIAHLQSRLLDAKAHFDELARLARVTQEPDYHSRALIGQALVSAALARTASGAAAASHTAAARAAFESAEALLDDRLWRVPLTATRRAFLPRFTAGTAAFLAFLLSQGEVRQALTVARRAQVRGLVTDLSFDTLTLLPQAQRAVLTQARDELIRRSNELQEQSTAPAGSQAALLSQLESLLAHLHDAGLDRQLPLHELQPGEAMHLCHPLPGDDLVCFVATRDELAFTQLDKGALQKATTPAQQSELLLRPFAALINRARVLRILPSPQLRAVDFPALPWPGDSGYLASGERLVVYALDLAFSPRPEAPAVHRQALMLTNLSLQYAQRSAPWMYQKLQQLGWQVTPYSNQPFERGYNPKRLVRCWLGAADCPPVLPLPFAPLAGTASALSRVLPTVELAQLDTHAAYNSESGWQSQLIMPNETALTVADLLMLPRAPRFTVLMVCEGGTAGKDADADDISLAQALLLRGGEAVVAASRVLPDELAEQWSQALYSAQDKTGPYLEAAAPRLPQAFHVAQAAMRDRRPSSWSTLRLFVP